MPLVLTESLVQTIYSHEIKRIDINLEDNKHYIVIADKDVSGNEIRRRNLELSIFDDFGTILIPSTWPVENLTGPEMYSLIKEFIFLGLQDLPGDSGVGAGTIT